MVDFHQRLSDGYYQDLLMGNWAVAAFDVDQVVPMGNIANSVGWVGSPTP